MIRASASNSWWPDEIHRAAGGQPGRRLMGSPVLLHQQSENAYPSTYGPVSCVPDQWRGGRIDDASSIPELARQGSLELVEALTEYGRSNRRRPDLELLCQVFRPGAASQAHGRDDRREHAVKTLSWAPADGVINPYYTLNGGANLETPSLCRVFPAGSGFDGSLTTYDARSVTADRVSREYVLFVLRGRRRIRDHQWRGLRGHKYLVDQSLERPPASMLNSNLFPVRGRQPFFYWRTSGWFSTGRRRLLSDQPTAELRGPLFRTFLKSIVSVSARLRQGQSYPSMYIVGWVNNVDGVWGVPRTNAQSWTQLGTYPLNSLDHITTISGDPNIYGQVYIGFQGSGYA